MKMKKLVVIGATLASSAGLAQAQQQSINKLTLYGVADLSVTRLQSGGKGHMWQVRDGGLNSSRLGFTGMEDLGGGLRAHFVIEGQLNSDTGTGLSTNTTNQPSGGTTAGGMIWNRKSTVSLISPYGEIRLGRDYTATFVPTTYMDPFLSGGVPSASSIQAFYTQSVVPPTLVRASNMVQYYIPPTLLSGLYAYVQAAPSEGTGATYTGLGGGYRSGPLLVAAAIGRTKNPLGGSVTLSPETQSADNKLDVWSAGIAYKFSNGLRPMAFYHAQKMAVFGTTSATNEYDRKVNDFLVGFTWEVGASLFKMSYMKRDDKGLADNDPTLIGLGYQYSLSKRTNLYANFVEFRNSPGGSYNFSSSGLSPVAGEKARTVQVGMAHAF